ncbi:MAG: hypothetical protein MR555_03495 [Spirochaetia bacterium]|nr:hypothetical protein [Spirochaetia bacterium]
MLAKKYINTVIKTIKNASEIDDLFAEANKSKLMDFVRENVEKNTNAMRILVDLVNVNFFDLFYREEYNSAVEISKKVLNDHEATETQIEEFLTIFFDFSDDDEQVEEEYMDEDEVVENEEVEKPENEENLDEDEMNAEETEVVEEETEEIVEDETLSNTSQDNKKSSKEESELSKLFDGNISFAIRIILAIVLFIVAVIAIKPTNDDVFYKWYFILFIGFSLVVLACCCIAQFDISVLWKFYRNFKASRGRREDLESKEISINKHVREICNAYSESFLQNETYNKTRSNADLYFGGETYFNDMNTLPIQAFLKIIPGTFIGFGILGTFIGFAGGLSSINISDSQSLLNGVQNLLDGLKNAFNTSIVGVLASMFLNFVLIHPLFNRLDRCSKILCDYLDTKFFVSEVDAMQVTLTKNNRIQIFPFPQTMGELYTMLEQVASNINQMGATVGDQVTQSVKATLDKTIEKIIKEEIKKLKEEMNSSITLLQECQKHLQNAPAHLKEAAEKMQAAAVNNDELFKRQNQDSVEAYSKVVELSLANYKQKLEDYTKSVEETFNNLNDKFASYAKTVEETSEEMLNIKNTLALMPEDFSNVDKSIQTTTEKLSANQTTLENALSESTQAFDKTTEISELLTEAYESQSKKIEDMISKFTDVLNEYKETSKESKELLAGFKGMDEQIAQIFEHINENTKAYSDVIGNSLTNYLNSFTEATKDVSAKFADATDALREEVEKLNKSERSKEEK